MLNVFSCCLGQLDVEVHDVELWSSNVPCKKHRSVLSCEHMLSCQRVSQHASLNYCRGNFAPVVPCSTLRMWRRLMCKILQFVCLLCFGTIKTQGKAFGSALFTCRCCDCKEMEQKQGWGTNVSSRWPHRRGARIRAAVGSLTCERRAAVRLQ